MSKILIIGAGAMGTAFSLTCVDNNHSVVLIGSPLEDKLIDKLNKGRRFYQTLDCYLPKKLKLFKANKLYETFKSKPNVVVIAVNSMGIEWIGKILSKFHNPKVPIILLTKGLTIFNKRIEPLSYKLLSIIKKNQFSKFKNLSITSVAGPCIAKSLAKKKRTSVVFSNEFLKNANRHKKIFETHYYKIECSKDHRSVQYCAAIKNFYSMIIGSVSDLNTASVIFYKSFLEMSKFIKMYGGQEKTAYGLAGLADLHVSSAGGRNSKMGKYLGDGYTYRKAKLKFMKNETVEGADLAFELGPKILNKYHKKNFPLMHSLVESICLNKKLTLKNY